MEALLEGRKLRIKLSKAQKSALQVAGLEDPEGAGERLLKRAWKGNYLEFAPEEADDLHSALTDASNSEDAYSTEKGHVDREGSKYARAAARSLGLLGTKVLKLGLGS
jgi:hypothetical protein